MSRNVDILKQGFMKQGSVNPAKTKPFDEKAWAKSCVANSRKAYERMWGKGWAA